MTILERIIESKRAEVERRKAEIPLGALKDAEWFSREVVSISGTLDNAAGSGVIAEFKRRSPSKGVINDQLAPADVAAAYERAGAWAVSVLTDGPFFGGDPDDLRSVRKAVGLPVLRKDFIVDPYQVYESRAMGADVILLIAACLEQGQCTELAALAHDIGLEVLLELHTAEELEYISVDTDLVGVNNRDLKTFKVDLDYSIRLCGAIGEDHIRVAESGLTDAGVIRKLRDNGFQGFLIGEYFMRTSDPGTACSELIRQI